MQVHVARRIESTRLPYSRVLLPVYEAIMNSIHAIEDGGAAEGNIEVVLERDLALLSSEHHSYVPDLQNVMIVDNGVGFTPANLEAFSLVDTPHKERRGGKGLGRLTWLRAFDSAEIDSVYLDGDGQAQRCRFEFQRTRNGVERLDRRPVKQDTPKTSVRLLGLKEPLHRGT
jgi:hypothetical protein